MPRFYLETYNLPVRKPDLLPAGHYTCGGTAALPLATFPLPVAAPPEVVYHQTSNVRHPLIHPSPAEQPQAAQQVEEEPEHGVEKL